MQVLVFNPRQELALFLDCGQELTSFVADEIRRVLGQMIVKQVDDNTFELHEQTMN
jgi:hypothetical protein